MKIGSKVIVAEHIFIKELVGKTGTIVAEKLPESQIAMLRGIASWTVKFDEPLKIRGEVIDECSFREDSLELIEKEEVVC